VFDALPLRNLAAFSVQFDLLEANLGIPSIPPISPPSPPKIETTPEEARKHDTDDHGDDNAQNVAWGRRGIAGNR
jgi:hypothetical protein